VDGIDGNGHVTMSPDDLEGFGVVYWIVGIGTVGLIVNIALAIIYG